MPARAADALEHQARYARMFNDPRYIEYQNVATKMVAGLSGVGDAGVIESHIAKSAMMAARVAANSGDAYWWDPRICTLIESVYDTMPPWVMTRHALPTPSGFLWFDKPIKAGDRLIKAIFWALMEIKDDPGPDQQASMLAVRRISARPEDMNSARGVIATALETNGEEPIDLYDPNVNGLGKGQLYTADPRWERPRSTIMWSFERGHDDIVGTDLNPLAYESGLRPIDEIAQDMQGKPVRDDATNEAKILAACLAFLQQRFLTTHKQIITDRSARRRLERAGHKPEVRIVALRKAFNRMSGASRQGGDPVEWSCRWIVGGHWRNQFFPSTGQHHPVYILPYVKGPEELEIKSVPDSVFSVYR